MYKVIHVLRVRGDIFKNMAFKEIKLKLLHMTAISMVEAKIPQSKQHIMKAVTSVLLMPGYSHLVLRTVQQNKP